MPNIFGRREDPRSYFYFFLEEDEEVGLLVRFFGMEVGDTVEMYATICSSSASP